MNKNGQPFMSSRKRREAHAAAESKRGPEKLVYAAVEMPDGVTYCGGARSHSEARSHVPGVDGWCSNQLPGEVCGFITSTGRFLSRKDAVPVGVKAKQLHESWLTTRRDLLSSDIHW